MTFEELYHEVLQREMKGTTEGLPADVDPQQLDCLLHPEQYPPILQTKPCTSCAFDEACVRSCVFDAIARGADGKLFIDPSRCTGCGACEHACQEGKLTASRDILPAMEAVRRSGKPSYALIAPAFLGQFSDKVTPGRLRSAFKALGFTGMVEVALFADILTMKEALEFDKNIVNESDYQLTSCCCPVWIAMIRKVYHELMPHVPGSVSPMIACGRVIKKLYPDAVTVFVGPCMAKKSEAREPDLAGAVDYVLTFREVQDIFDAAEIDPALLPEDEKEHSSRAGRIYAHTGGVSEAVVKTVEQLSPERKISVKTCKADGVPGCQAMIRELKAGNVKGNFYEGMGCVGGCVGGPKSMIDRGKAAELVDHYGDQAPYRTPLENQYVKELLHKIGFDTVEDLLKENNIFTRTFD